MEEIYHGNEGRQIEKWVTILPSEGPSDLGRCNCDTFASTTLSTRSPKRNSNVDVKHLRVCR
jgi:hypothetical protein